RSRAVRAADAVLRRQRRARADAVRRRIDLVDRAPVARLLRGRRARMGVSWTPRHARAGIRESSGAGGNRRHGCRADARPPVERRRAMIRAIWGMARNDLAVWLRS